MPSHSRGRITGTNVPLRPPSPATPAFQLLPGSYYPWCPRVGHRARGGGAPSLGGEVRHPPGPAAGPGARGPAARPVPGAAPTDLRQASVTKISAAVVGALSEGRTGAASRAGTGRVYGQGRSRLSSGRRRVSRALSQIWEIRVICVFIVVYFSISCEP